MIMQKLIYLAVSFLILSVSNGVKTAFASVGMVVINWDFIFCIMLALIASMSANSILLGTKKGIQKNIYAWINRNLIPSLATGGFLFVTPILLYLNFSSNNMQNVFMVLFLAFLAAALANFLLHKIHKFPNKKINHRQFNS
jgi:hypothetical protein